VVVTISTQNTDQELCTFESDVFSPGIGDEVMLIVSEASGIVKAFGRIVRKRYGLIHLIRPGSRKTSLHTLEVWCVPVDVNGKEEEA